MKIKEQLIYKNYWIGLGILYTGIMITLCLIPSSQAQSTIPHLDKVFHFIAHFIWTYWFAQIFSDRRRIILASLILGGVIEILQAKTGYRHAEPLDVMANFIGAVFGVIPMLPKSLLRIEKLIKN